jgi:hypothetical protein
VKRRLADVSKHIVAIAKAAGDLTRPCPACAESMVVGKLALDHSFPDGSIKFTRDWVCECGEVVPQEVQIDGVGQASI